MIDQMNNDHPDTQEILTKHIDEIQQKILILDDQKLILTHELERAEKALSVIREKKQRAAYSKSSSLKDKIMYCFTINQQILSISSIVDILLSKDPDFSSWVNLSDSIRVQMAKLIKEEVVVSYKTEKMRNVYYALKSWTDAMGELRSRYY